ncbi:MAG: hypothetical protein ONB12_00800, partial [candidate division KSB1 bacterium]|nr:hypothetical protein [candidate division KSB1 bacterium]
MHPAASQRLFSFLGFLFFFSVIGSAQELAIVETVPRPNQVDVSAFSNITLRFNRPISADWLNESTL